jgi:hypothetical protein
MQQDRYCRNCGQALQTEDRFCANCGRPVHATATVPTPEADFSVPPPEQAEDRAVPPQAPQARSGEGQTHTAPIGPILGMVAVFLVLGIGTLVQGMPAAPAGKDLGFQIGVGIGPAIGTTLAAAVVPVALGGVYYITAYKKGVTFREAIFNWPLVIVAGIVAFLSLLFPEFALFLNSLYSIYSL